jgi:hypothetical protein
MTVANVSKHHQAIFGYCAPSPCYASTCDAGQIAAVKKVPSTTQAKMLRVLPSPMPVPNRATTTGEFEMLVLAISRKMGTTMAGRQALVGATR